MSLIFGKRRNGESKDTLMEQLNNGRVFTFILFDYSYFYYESNL